MSSRRFSVIASIALLVGACSEAGLQPINEDIDHLVDDLLMISGEVCTSPPTEQVFPVKIMFIVDTSGSMQFTDPSDNAPVAQAACLASCQANLPSMTNCAAFCANANNPGRQAAVQKVVDRFKNNPAVSFNIITFNGRIQTNGGTSDRFTNDVAEINQALTTLMEAEITTDYQGALSAAYQALEKDMIGADPVERARTKYVIMFLSDGAANPVCKPGCDGPGKDTIDIGGGIIMDSWCDLPRNQWCDNFNADSDLCTSMEQWYPAMAEPCRAYNTEAEILKKTNEIMDLGEYYGVGEIRIHTAFLFNDGLPKAILDLFYPTLGCQDPADGGKCKPDCTKYTGPSCSLTAQEMKESAEGILIQMAAAGDGFYRSFNNGQQIDFLDVNYASVARPFGITNFIVTNMNSRSDINRLVVDSDGDGVDDTTEFESRLKMDETLVDSDDDGFGDKLELDRLHAGFDPGDPKIPVRTCRANERIDRDGDGLRDCEEAIIGTNPKLPDTDRDRIPDGIEFLFGTNPLKNDSKTDLDFDGKLAATEINIHADPTIADPDVHANFKYIYDVREQPERPDLRKCYQFKVKHVRLVTTKERAGAGTLGFNDIMVYFGEGPSDDPSDYGGFLSACVRAQYVEPNYKYPANGRVVLEPSDFYKLEELLNRKELAKTDPDADPCVGAQL